MTIYEQHEKSFANVQAYVIAKDNNRVATIAFKFPKDGAGRLYAYVHWIGKEMVKGMANGYGYDKKSAACESAMESLKKQGDLSNECMVFYSALRDIGGSNWDRALEKEGFNVWQAV